MPSKDMSHYQNPGAELFNSDNSGPDELHRPQSSFEELRLPSIRPLYLTPKKKKTLTPPGSRPTSPDDSIKLLASSSNVVDHEPVVNTAADSSRQLDRVYHSGHIQKPLPLLPPEPQDQQSCSSYVNNEGGIQVICQSAGPTQTEEVPAVDLSPTPLFGQASPSSCYSQLTINERHENEDFDEKRASSRSKTTVSSEIAGSGWIYAHNVFRRGAAPLLLPALDDVLERSAPPQFSKMTKDQLSAQEWFTWKEWMNERNGKRNKRRDFWNWWKKVARKNQECTGDETETQRSLVSSDLEASTEFCENMIFPMHLRSKIRRNHIFQTQGKVIGAGLFGRASDEEEVETATLGGTLFDTLQSLELARDVFQITVLLIGFRGSLSQDTLTSNIGFLNPSGDKTVPDRIFWVFLDLLPATIGLDFLAVAGRARWSAWVLIAPAGFALLEFYVLTGGWTGPGSKLKIKVESQQGLEPVTLKTKTWRGNQNYTAFVIIFLSSAYIPVTKICISAFFWTSEFWAIPNPYIGVDDPNFESLGLSEENQNNLNFCYTTTIQRSGEGLSNFNWAIIIMPLSVTVFLLFTCWFPIRLWRTVKTLTVVEKNKSEKNRENQVLEHEYDNHLKSLPRTLSYLYHCQRRSYALLPAYILLIKLNLIIFSILFIKDNCVFRTISRSIIDRIRQAITLYFRPFKNLKHNSTCHQNIFGFLVTSLCGLGVAVASNYDTSFWKTILIIYLLMLYLLNIHFLVVDTKAFRRFSLRLTNKIDIDVGKFSASFAQKQVNFEIWKETLCTVFFGYPEYFPKENRRVEWNETASNLPYLLDFRGSHAERLIENLKSLNSIGAERYKRAANTTRRANSESLRERLKKTIWGSLTGPDCFWKPPATQRPKGVTTFFGRADVIPFPFTITFRYDQSPEMVCISELKDLHAYVQQNQMRDVLLKKKVRHTLRAMEGREIFAPVNVRWESVKDQNKCFGGKRASQCDVQFRSGILRIGRNCQNLWREYNYNSGFEVSIEYSDGHMKRSDGSIHNNINHTRRSRELGIRDDYEMTLTLAKIFYDNRNIINTSLGRLESVLTAHRVFFAKEATWKNDKMSPSFLAVFLDETRKLSIIEDIKRHVKHNEINSQMRDFPQICKGFLNATEERLRIINKTNWARWWYALFSEIYFKNSSRIPEISNKPEDFSPHYKSSICYAPMPRCKLEEFLIERKLASIDGKSGYFHSGLLNQIYFYLDQEVFSGENYPRFPQIDDSTTLRVFDDRSSQKVPEKNKNQVNSENGTKGVLLRKLLPRSVLHEGGIYQDSQDNDSMRIGIVRNFLLKWLRFIPTDMATDKNQILLLCLSASGNSYEMREVVDGISTVIPKTSQRPLVSSWSDSESEGDNSYEARCHSLYSSSTIYGYC